MRISDWSSDVCSSDLVEHVGASLLRLKHLLAPGFRLTAFLIVAELLEPFSGLRRDAVCLGSGGACFSPRFAGREHPGSPDAAAYGAKAEQEDRKSVV